MSWLESCRKPSGQKASDRACAKLAATVYCLLAQSAGAWAQAPAPAPAEGHPAPVVTEIAVTGERQAVVTRVDRKVYAVSRADEVERVPFVYTEDFVLPAAPGERGEQDYFRVYPSLHVARKLDENQTLTFSYAKRVSRPYWQALNPIVFRNDAYGVRTGNPDLKPSEVDSFETGWSRERGPSSLSATLFARKTYDEMTYVTIPISPTMVLNRPENIGESAYGGLELSASGRLLPRVDYRLSGKLFYYEIDAGNLGYAAARSTTTHQAKASLTFKTGARGRAQLDLQTWGKQLTPQGYRRGNTALDADFRYQWRPNVSLAATLSDVFESRHDQTILDTAEISGSNRVTQPGRIA